MTTITLLLKIQVHKTDHMTCAAQYLGKHNGLFNSMVKVLNVGQYVAELSLGMNMLIVSMSIHAENLETLKYLMPSDTETLTLL